MTPAQAALIQLKTALAKKNNATSARDRIAAHNEAKFWLARAQTAPQRVRA